LGSRNAEGGKMNSEYRLPISDNKIGVNQFLILGILAHFRSLKVISLLSMQKKLAKDIFTLKRDGAKRHQ
jgi:hypothetical protein